MFLQKGFSLTGAAATQHPEVSGVDTGPFLRKKTLHHCGVSGNHFSSQYGSISSAKWDHREGTVFAPQCATGCVKWLYMPWLLYNEAM